MSKTLTHEDLQKVRDHLPRRLPLTNPKMEAIHVAGEWHIGSPGFGDLFLALSIDQGVFDLAYALLHPSEDLKTFRSHVQNLGLEETLNLTPPSDVDLPKGLTEAWQKYREALQHARAARLRIERYLKEVQ